MAKEGIGNPDLRQQLKLAKEWWPTYKLYVSFVDIIQRSPPNAILDPQLIAEPRNICIAGEEGHPVLDIEFNGAEGLPLLRAERRTTSGDHLLNAIPLPRSTTYVIDQN